jgi:pimeloyl-ACP methyl ester carboxylesterase
MSTLEQNVLEISKLEHEWFIHIDVPVDDFNGNKVNIRTLIVYEEFYNLRKGILRPIPKKETLVILHGYGGAGVLFFPIMKKLSKYFNLVFLDTIGMAGSSRPDNYKPDFTP